MTIGSCSLPQYSYMHVSFTALGFQTSEALVDLARGYLALTLGALALVVVLGAADSIAAAPADTADAGVSLIARLERGDVFGTRHQLSKNVRIK
jgi:hypothetical protein